MPQSETNSISTRAARAVRAAIRPGLKTAWWMARLTFIVSISVSLLQYIGVIDVVARWLNPVFNLLGLPGEAALVFMSSYLVNIYSAIACAATLNLDLHAMTILSVMCLCAHNMLIEIAVQQKTGSSAVRMCLLRTLSALIGGYALNLMLPAAPVAADAVMGTAVKQLPLDEFALKWLISTGKLLLKMFTLIMGLNILQKLLAEFGFIRLLSKLLRPALKVFGLPAKTSFLWIVANILGLAYGAAVMLDEVEQGKISHRDVDLLNHHIAISHSNLEDVSLFMSVGVGLWWMLLPRWVMAAAAVWLRKGELAWQNRRPTQKK